MHGATGLRLSAAPRAASSIQEALMTPIAPSSTFLPPHLTRDAIRVAADFSALAALERGGKAAAALDTLAAVWRVRMPARAAHDAARVIAPQEHAAHAPFRAWLECACSPDALAQLRPLAGNLVSARLALIQARGRSSFDLVQEIAQPLWPNVLAAWTGLAEQQRRRLHHLSCAISVLSDPGKLSPRRLANLVAALDELRRMFANAYRYPRHVRGLPSLFASLETAWTPAIGPIQDESALAATQLLLSGRPAASELIGPVIDLLVERPRLSARFRAKRESAVGLVDDMQAALAKRRAAHRKPISAGAAMLEPLSAALARMQTLAVLDALLGTHERIARSDDGTAWEIRGDGAKHLDHLALRVGT